MKKFILLALMAVVTLGAYAQMQTITIQTNASLKCQKCTDRFKENVPFFKGVKDYTYDASTAKITINYDSKKTNPDQLRKEISKMGYDADAVKADPAAREKLPACCKNGGTCGHGDAQHKCQHVDGQHKCQGANGEHKCQHADGQHKCQGQAAGEHKCQHAEGEHKCQGHADGQHKCQGANGEHKCQGHAEGQPICQGSNGEHKCQHAEGEHKCQGHAEGQHKCQGANGEHKCQHAEGEHKCQGHAEGQHKCPNHGNVEKDCQKQHTTGNPQK